MQHINNMYQGAQNYWKEIPQNTFRQMVASFTAGFVISTVMASNAKDGLFTGAVSASAALIHGLVTPLFKEFCGQGFLTFEQEVCRSSISIIGAAYLAKAFGNPIIIKILPACAVIHTFLIYMEPFRRDLNKTNLFIL